MAYDLHSPFDLQQHKNTFINYLEVVIRPSGLVEYAVPSHQEKLLRIWAVDQGLVADDDDSWYEVRYSRWFMETLTEKFSIVDYNEQLLNATGCVSVWSKHVGLPDAITSEQLAVLRSFISEGVLHESVLPLIESTEVREWQTVQ